MSRSVPRVERRYTPDCKRELKALLLLLGDSAAMGTKFRWASSSLFDSYPAVEDNDAPAPGPGGSS